jgi:ABC-type multidrug transport system fused ATPase/permease subunit
MLCRPISEFVRASAFLEAGRIGIRTVFSVFENTSPIEEPIRPIRPAKREGKIEFRNVWFSHGKGRGGLRGVKFTIEAGQKILVVGRSGAGKSTLFNLLLRLYEPERGEVLIDGVNIRRMKLAELRDYFSVVVQDQLHVEDTVLNNIFLGSIEETGIEKETQLEKALEMGRNMGMNRFIASLGQRFNHKVDASGMGFSRGELQKLAIMRAAAKDAPIVLLDEPTASLDHHNEREIIRIMHEQFKAKTTLMISHRPLPQYHPDWILVFRKGWLEAQGNHHYLMEHCKFYRQLSRGPRRPLDEVA